MLIVDRNKRLNKIKWNIDVVDIGLFKNVIVVNGYCSIICLIFFVWS